MPIRLYHSGISEDNFMILPFSYTAKRLNATVLSYNITWSHIGIVEIKASRLSLNLRFTTSSGIPCPPVSTLCLIRSSATSKNFHCFSSLHDALPIL